MKRRSFLTATTLASVGLSTLIITSCMNNSKNEETANDSEPVDNLLFDLDEQTIASLTEKFAAGTYTIEQVTKLYLDRILAIDKDGPTLNSVIEINPEALEIAKKLDAELAGGKKRGPLIARRIARCRVGRLIVAVFALAQNVVKEASHGQPLRGASRPP